MGPGWTAGEEAAAAELASLARARMRARPIALAGFMGVGKTTVGRMLASALGRPFHDTDDHVQAVSGRTIHDLFLAGEEAEFRRLEAAAVAELVQRGPVVIALGGGALLADRTRTILRERALLIHLHMRWHDLRDRVPELIAPRPLLRGRSLAEVHRLYLQRQATYRSAVLRVTVGRRTPAEAAADVLGALGLPDAIRAGGSGSAVEATPPAASRSSSSSVRAAAPR